jgi:hypothetical protein
MLRQSSGSSAPGAEKSVKVAAARNRPDVMQRMGLHPAARRTDIPGLEIAGEIVALGSDVSDGKSATGSWPWFRVEDMPDIALRTKSRAAGLRPVDD